MANLILVRSSSKKWDLVLLIVLGVGAIIGGWYVDQQGHREPGLLLEIAGGVLALVGAGMLGWRLRSRQWLRVHREGFTVVDRTGEVDYDDAMVQSLALQTKQNYSEGELKSLTRTMRLWISDPDESEDPTPIVFQTTIKIGQDDPLEPLISRLSKQILDRGRLLLEQGRTFAGDGWVLERNNLVIAAKPDPLHCALDDIAMTGIFDQKLCLWRQNEDDVWARINIDSLNAYVLMQLIDERLAAKPKPEEQDDGVRMGRVLFERKSRATTRVILGLGAFTLFLLGLGMTFAAIGGPKRDRVAFGLIALGMVAGGIGCIVGILHSRRSLFRCHEYGLVKRGLLGEKTVRYGDLVAFTYQATRHFHNGVYTGTVFVLDFEPDPNSGSQRIRYSVTLRKDDEELDNLRDQVSQILGHRMYRDVTAGQTVKWTPALSLHGTTLTYTPLGLFGRKTTLDIPVSEIHQYKMADASCSLFREGQKKAVAQESMHARNFFPGFHCLLLMIGAGLENVSGEDEEEVEAED